MLKKQIFPHILTIAAALLLAGCFDSSLTFQLRYNQLSGLKQGNPVYFENNKIGQVEKISYTEKGDYLVDVQIATEFKNSTTEDSKFFIGPNPVEQQSMAVIIEQEKPGGAILKKGSIVEGSVKPGLLEGIVRSITKQSGVTEDEMRDTMQQLKESLNAISQQLDAELERTLEDLSARFQSFSEELQNVPDSEEVKKLEESIKQFRDEFNKAQKDVRDQIQNEILPQLQKEMDALRERLRRDGREDEIEVIDRQLVEMREI